ncbi:MAG: class I SAM-dependent methyltransferase, partial [Longimicrobiales bacterium]|nr:class I SAM-dependent methyltransferase [Longimicrobiales bacterium]
PQESVMRRRARSPGPALGPAPDPTPADGTLEPVPRCLACGTAERVPQAEVRAQMMPRDAPEERFAFVRCTRCGLVYLDPRVPAARLGRYYTRAYLPYRGATAWGPFAPLVAAGERAMDRARVALVRRYAAPGPAARVLDVGCGRPTFLRALVDATGCHGIGLDFSDHGWREEGERWTGLDLRVGEPGGMASGEGADVVTQWHYLEHDYAPRETLAGVREVVRGSDHPHGPRLFIEVPDHDARTRVRYGAGWAGYHAPRHTALYTAASLRTLLEGSGWEVVAMHRSGTLDPWVLAWMSRMEARGIDWAAGMAARFPGYVAGRLLWTLRTRGQRAGLGMLTAVARPGGGAP